MVWGRGSWLCRAVSISCPLDLGGPSSALGLAVLSCCFCRCICSGCYLGGCGAVVFLAILDGRRCWFGGRRALPVPRHWTLSSGRGEDTLQSRPLFLKQPIYFTAKQCTGQYLVCMIAPFTAAGRTNKPNNKQFLYMQSNPAIAGLDSTVVQ